MNLPRDAAMVEAVDNRLKELVDFDAIADDVHNKLLKAARDVADEVEYGLMYSIKENLANSLREMITKQISNKVESVFEALIEGNDELFVELIEANYNYSSSRGYPADSQWNTPEKLRLTIVEANADVLMREREADLQCRIEHQRKELASKKVKLQELNDKLTKYYRLFGDL